MEVLEYSDILAEVKGSLNSGRLKLTDQNIIFKNSKTGKVEQIQGNDMELVNFQRFVGSFGLRIFMKNGQLHRFIGLKSGEEEKIASFFKKNFKKDMLEKELSLRGWNWGTVNFTGAVLSFDCDKKTSFEIPLNHVSQCTTGKNEVTLEFHQNDDAPVSLMEMRYHIPTSEAIESDPVDEFYQNVMKQASVISVSGDAIAIFKEIHCLTPRGRYDIKIFQTFFQLHGKTFDYKIPMSTVLRLFLLPHKDNRQMFFVLSLDPPIKQGQTRYQYLVILFGMEEETSIELPFSKEELRDKYENKLTKELSGPVYEVLGKIMKVLLNRKLTGPGSFVGHSSTPAIGCSFKTAAGYLYPLERGFIYVHKPPIHIRFEEIQSVNFARSGGSTRSFDFEIELKSSTVHTFSSIEKEEYNKLFDFISSKKIHVKNTGKNDKASYKDDFGDSDNENEPDAYLERVKAEAKERDSDDGDDDSDESTDEDFNPGEQDEDDVAEEFDSNAESSESEEDEDDDAETKEKRAAKKKEKEKKRERREKRSERASRGSSSKSKKSKKNKDDGRPKRPTTAFMIWLNAMRETIKKENPGISIVDVAKKGGELWKELTDKSEWEGKAAKDKERYNLEMQNYKPPGEGDDDEDGDGDDDGAGSGRGSAADSTKRKKEVKKPITTTTTMAGAGFKSKEYISDDSSSDSDKEKSKKKRKKDDTSSASDGKSNKKTEKKKGTDDEEDEEEEEVEDTEETEEDTSNDTDKDLSRPGSGLGLNHGMGRITGSASIETLVRVGIEKEHGLSPDSKMVVLHDFTPCVDDELEVKRGQIVNILYRENDWVYVIGQDSRQEGFIPHSYCAPFNTQLAELAIKKKLPREQSLGSNSSNGSIPAGVAISGGGGIGGAVVGGGGGGGSGGGTVIGVNGSNMNINAGNGNLGNAGIIHSTTTTTTTDLTECVLPDISVETILDDTIINGSVGLFGIDNSLKHSQASLSSEPDYLPFAKDPSGRYIVLYTFIARDENDVSVERGEFVTVLNREDPEWFWIVRSDGQEGFIPSGFVYPADNIIQGHPKPQNCITTTTTTTNTLNNNNNINNNTHNNITNNNMNSNNINNNNNNNNIMMNNLNITSISTQQILGGSDPYHGTELVMLYDYKAQAPDDLSVRRGDWIYADLNNQTVDGWLWCYAPKTRKYGFIPKAYARPPATTSL